MLTFRTLDERHLQPFEAEVKGKMTSNHDN
jgi:hypothetical protein